MQRISMPQPPQNSLPTAPLQAASVDYSALITAAMAGVTALAGITFAYRRYTGWTPGETTAEVAVEGEPIRYSLGDHWVSKPHPTV